MAAISACFAKFPLSERPAKRKNPLENLELALLGAGIGTYTHLLEECGDAKAFPHGKYVHEHIIQSGYHRDTFLGNLLMQMYIKCGSVEDARTVFDGMLQPTVVSWTTMIAAYAQNGHLLQALKLGREMELNGLKPDKATLVCMVGVCSCLAEGKAIHARIVAAGFDSEVAIGNSLIEMYGKCSCLDDARMVFDNMRRKNVISWNAMIAAYAEHGDKEQVLVLYRQMVEIGFVKPATFVSILTVFTSLEDLAEGRAVLAKIIDCGFESEVAVGTALMIMYGKCGSVDDARAMFDKMHKKNLLSWNTMIAAYAQNGHPQEALNLYNILQMQYVQPDHRTFTSILVACGSLGVLEHAKMIHGHIKAFSLETELVIAAELVNIYSKCGSLKDARAVFDKMQSRDISCWNAMIAAYAQHRHARDALELYEQMDIQPDHITFVTLLHAGLVDEGWYCLDSMLQLGLTPSVEHYGCMVHLLGGRELHSEHGLKIMLAACRTYNDVERGVCAAAHIPELEPESSAAAGETDKECAIFMLTTDT